jgi:hypothetical protein
MARAIWKTPLKPGQTQVIQGPGVLKVVHAGMDPGRQLSIWFECTPGDRNMYSIEAQIFGTGHPIPVDEGWTHSTTFLEGPYVWHLYLKEPQPA